MTVVKVCRIFMQIKRVKTVVAILSIVFGLATFYKAETSSQPDSERFIQQLKERAQLDAESGKTAASVQEINLLFGNEGLAHGFSLRETFSIYEKQYEVIKKDQSLWSKVRPQAGWILSGILLLCFLFKELLQKTASEALQKLQQQIYSRLAGYAILRRTAVRRYRNALSEKYSQLVVPFRPDRPLNVREIYVPLKVRGANDVDQVEASQTISQHRRLMILGPPGSGKSMLLRHVALSCIGNNYFIGDEQLLPVFVELNRMNAVDKSIEEYLQEILRLNDFPKAGSFIHESLKKGRLILLFDGLDEVNTDKREFVVRRIVDFVDEFEKCRVLITCRSAVYKNEFSQSVDQTLDIVEFSDQQVRIFLETWQPYLPPGKSIEQLIQTLRERPRIMALARNPLLLTIIAYLYTDTDFVLPHSRTEFYDQAVDVLLRQWKEERNRFKAPHKRLILQELALFNQDGRSVSGRDRRSIDVRTILPEIQKVLPSLNLPNTEADRLLDEIVERSSIMLAIDGGTRYQFAHLTLQEFFAADALRDDGEGLLARYGKDPDAWRETVKLWCGLEHDSTDLIDRIYEHDPVTAFECLADAQMVQPDLSERIISQFKKELGINRDDAISRAFAAVASDVRPRGQEVFDFLVHTVNNATEARVSEAAAWCLSLTNMPRAAEALIVVYSISPSIRAALVRMGDLAVPAIAQLAAKGNLDALDDLQRIGTPGSAVVLASLLWDNNQMTATNAAWRLATLLEQANVEDALRKISISVQQRSQNIIRSIWAPFKEPIDSSLPIIAGRIGYLIDQFVRSPSQQKVLTEASQTIDDRIGVPLLLGQQTLYLVSYEKVKTFYESTARSRTFYEVLERLGQNIHVDIREVRDDFDQLYELIKDMTEVVVERQPNPNAEKRRAFSVRDARAVVKDTLEIITEILRIANATAMARLLKLLKPETQIEVFHRLMGPQVAGIEDWHNLFTPAKFRFKRSWQFRLALFIASILSLLPILLLVWFSGDPHYVWLGVYLVSASITWVVVLINVSKENYENDSWSRLLTLLVLPFILLRLLIRWMESIARREQPELQRPKIGIGFIVILLCLFFLLIEASIGGFSSRVFLISTSVAVPLTLLFAGVCLAPRSLTNYVRVSEDVDDLLMIILSSGQSLCFASSVFFIAFSFFSVGVKLFGIFTVVLVGLGLIILLYFLCVNGLQRDRAARNPLHGILDKRVNPHGVLRVDHLPS